MNCFPFHFPTFPQMSPTTFTPLHADKLSAQVGKCGFSSCEAKPRASGNGACRQIGFAGLRLRGSSAIDLCAKKSLDRFFTSALVFICSIGRDSRWEATLFTSGVIDTRVPTAVQCQDFWDRFEAPLLRDFLGTRCVLGQLHTRAASVRRRTKLMVSGRGVLRN